MRIEINLLGGPKKKKRKPGAGISLPDFGALVKQIKDPLLVGAVAAWVVAVAVMGVLFVTQRSAVRSLEEEAQQVRTEARRYNQLIAQKRRAENLRDSLEKELDAIREIDADRYVWPHIMDEVAKNLPDYTWLVGLTVLASEPVLAEEADTAGPEVVRFQIDGRTSDIGAYTRFLRQLAASPWIGDVIPGATSQVVEDEKVVTAFGITASFRQADSAFMRTVPVAESVR